MKIEKIAENIIKVTLHAVELKKWRVSYESLNSDNPEVCGMFRDIIRRINEVTGTDFSGCSLGVEVMMQDKDTVVMVMTRKNAGLKEEKTKAVKYRYRLQQKNKKGVTMVYLFGDMDAVVTFAKNNLYYCLLFDGKNSLYKHDSGINLVVNIPGELKEYLPAFNDRISEYADVFACPELCVCYLEEYEKPIIGKNALKTAYYKM